MARRNDHSREELIALLIDVGWNITGREGFEAVTARRVAQEAGYTPGTIYNLFGSMDDLYLHVSARTLDRLHGALEGCADQRHDPLEAVRHMARAYRNFARDHKNHWLMLFLHKLPPDREPPDWFQDKLRSVFEPLETVLSPFFPPADADKCAQAARALWGSFHGLCYLQETGKIQGQSAGSDEDALGDILIDNFMAGFAWQQYMGKSS
jgi:AcrR family transcriptional regulator